MSTLNEKKTQKQSIPKLLLFFTSFDAFESQHNFTSRELLLAKPSGIRMVELVSKE